MIIKVSDKLKCREIRLLEVTPKEMEDSKEKLEIERSKACDKYRKRKSKYGS